MLVGGRRTWCFLLFEETSGVGKAVIDMEILALQIAEVWRLVARVPEWR